MKIEDIFEKFFIELSIPKSKIIYLHIGLKGLYNKFYYDRRFVNKNDISEHIFNLIKDIYKPETILIPAFTYSFLKGVTYNNKKSPSEVGIFSESMRKSNIKFVRSKDAVFSTLCFGKIDFLPNEINYDAFGEASLFNIIKDDHIILNINTPKIVSSYLHFLEQQFSVPYRKFKTFFGKISCDDRDHEINYRYFVRSEGMKSEWDREYIADDLYKKGILNVIRHQEFKISAFSSQDLNRYIGERLQTNPLYLLGE